MKKKYVKPRVLKIRQAYVKPKTLLLKLTPAKFNLSGCWQAAGGEDFC